MSALRNIVLADADYFEECGSCVHREGQEPCEDCYDGGDAEYFELDDTAGHDSEGLRSEPRILHLEPR